MFENNEIIQNFLFYIILSDARLRSLRRFHFINLFLMIFETIFFNYLNI